MTSTPARILGRAAGKRVAGSKPGVGPAILAAAIVGVAAAVATYKLLRGG